MTRVKVKSTLSVEEMERRRVMNVAARETMMLHMKDRMKQPDPDLIQAFEEHAQHAVDPLRMEEMTEEEAIAYYQLEGRHSKEAFAHEEELTEENDTNSEKGGIESLDPNHQNESEDARGKTVIGSKIDRQSSTRVIRKTISVEEMQRRRKLNEAQVHDASVLQIDDSVRRTPPNEENEPKPYIPYDDYKNEYGSIHHDRPHHSLTNIPDHPTNIVALVVGVMILLACCQCLRRNRVKVHAD